MEKYIKREYLVQSSGPIYRTKDLEKTIAWFENVLGWYGNIDEYDVNGKGEYGFVTDMPIQLTTKLNNFNGMHLVLGEPLLAGEEMFDGMVAFMQVKNVEALYQYVVDHNWNEITEVITQPWGGKVCFITTIDGSKIGFYE
ncbi:MAG: VOC family protein [Coprobacillaceae bacterium]